MVEKKCKLIPYLLMDDGRGVVEVKKTPDGILASDSRYRAYPQTSLLTCRLGFDQVGLAPIADTHPLVRNNQFLSRMGFPRLWIYLGTTGTINILHLLIPVYHMELLASLHLW